MIPKKYMYVYVVCCKQAENMVGPTGQLAIGEGWDDLKWVEGQGKKEKK